MKPALLIICAAQSPWQHLGSPTRARSTVFFIFALYDGRCPMYFLNHHARRTRPNLAKRELANLDTDETSRGLAYTVCLETQCLCKTEEERRPCCDTSRQRTVLSRASFKLMSRVTLYVHFTRCLRGDLPCHRLKSSECSQILNAAKQFRLTLWNITGTTLSQYPHLNLLLSASVRGLLVLRTPIDTSAGSDF
jgi:hypothetical protein